MRHSQFHVAARPGACAVSTGVTARQWGRALALGCALTGPAVVAQTIELDDSLNEQVVQIDKKTTLFTIKLETTLYKPDGAGPFPVVVINHGKAEGNPRFQSRYRPALAARYFLERGYAVVVPMRQGFSASGGSYIGGGCNVESNGRVQAEDVKAALDYLAGQPWADVRRVLVMGQSHGGWTALAFGTLGYPGVKGLVNFAGGLRQESCPNWQSELAGGAAGYGKETRVPSLWFYGDNDAYFDQPTYRSMYEQYSRAGGKARLVAFGKFGPDAHGMFGSRAGLRIWQPEVTRFLASIGLPYEAQPQFAKYGGATTTSALPPTDLAPLEDARRGPHARAPGSGGYAAGKDTLQ